MSDLLVFEDIGDIFFSEILEHENTENFIELLYFNVLHVVIEEILQVLDGVDTVLFRVDSCKKALNLSSVIIEKSTNSYLLMIDILDDSHRVNFG